MPENPDPQDEPATDRRRRTLSANSSVIITSGGQSWTTRITVDDVDVTNAVRGFQLGQRARELPTLVLDLAIVPTAEAPTVAQSAMTEVLMPDETAALLCRAGWTPPGPASRLDEMWHHRRAPNTAARTAIPGQPDGIDDDSTDLPDQLVAAERVRRYVRGTGDGLYDVTTDTDDGEPAPLYGRDLEALCRAALDPGQDRAADNERTIDYVVSVDDDEHLSVCHPEGTFSAILDSGATLGELLAAIHECESEWCDTCRGMGTICGEGQSTDVNGFHVPCPDCVAPKPATSYAIQEERGGAIAEAVSAMSAATATALASYGERMGDALTDLLARAREHHETHHQSEAASDAWAALDQAMTPIVAGELARWDSDPDGPLYELTVATRGPGGEAKVLVSYGDGRLVLTCQECGHLADVEDGPGALPPLVADALDHQRISHNHAKEAS